MAEDWTACTLNLAGGASLRFGPDEADPGDVPIETPFGTKNPGGFGDGSITLRRPPNLRADDAALFADAVLYGPGGRVYYEGRVKGVPQVGVTEIRLELEGWVAHLSDNEAFRFLGVHNAFDEWRESTVSRRLALAEGSYLPESPGSSEDPTQPALVMNVGPKESTTKKGICEAMLYLDGLSIFAVYFTWAPAGNVNLADSEWQFEVRLSDDDVQTSVDTTTDIFAGGADDGIAEATTLTRKYAFVEWAYDDETLPLEEVFIARVPALSVFGTHGIPAVQIGDGRWGISTSEALKAALSAGAPMLNWTTESIEDSEYTTAHLVHKGTMQALVESVNKTGGSQLVENDWGVYEGREFFWRTPGAVGRTWRVRRDQVATPVSEGPRTENRWSAVVVEYQDGNSNTRTVGPLGSGADFETAELEDTDADNPATSIAGRTKLENAGTTDQTGAINIGKARLLDANSQARRGSVAIKGMATDFDTGVEEPACMVRACDQVYIEDDEVPALLPINSTESPNPLEVSATIGAPPVTVDVLLARLLAGGSGRGPATTRPRRHHDNGSGHRF